MVMPPPARWFHQHRHRIRIPCIPRVSGCTSTIPCEPVQCLCRGILLGELLVRTRLPDELHAVELDSGPEEAVLDLLCLVGRVVVPGPGQEGLELVLGVVAAVTTTPFMEDDESIVFAFLDLCSCRP
jgi:hypothetical protein